MNASTRAAVSTAIGMLRPEYANATNISRLAKLWFSTTVLTLAELERDGSVISIRDESPGIVVYRYALRAECPS